ncbi:polysaccharide deacetylase family protein [Pedobacter puniceum]|uniref:Polysaccharide deacetylase family protein n=1 Tax=Pedobacter puniceum TaxID=2666136 RepID=A0A7K0FI34_9SPHI|nr:polysaccharide deacetylase family protein [Pedobacter puniceum]MRX45568.1 polysaccharide deacetylase family protein [Pedobacter puniceum]
MYLVKTPWLLKKFYPQNLIWNKSRDKKIIYLTFDDGPIPIVTPFVLEILKKFNAKATFFCIGDNINKHQDIFFQLKADGHAIGNHTYNHLNGWKSDNKKYLDNILKCQELTQTDLFRPPYGRIKKSQIKNLESKIKNQKIIMWDVLSGDFDTQLSPEKCLNNVLKHTKNGSIVVFHDSLKAFDRLKYTLPKALAHWQAQGYEFHSIH